MTVKLAMYKGEGNLGNLGIRLWTGSIYSHCELVVDGWCYSSSVMDGGVRRKSVGPAPHQIGLGRDKWDVFELPWADRDQVVGYYLETDGDTYGWGGLILNQMFNLNRDTPHAQFCSRWCAAAVGIPSPDIYNPGTLDALALWRNLAK